MRRLGIAVPGSLAILLIAGLATGAGATPLLSSPLLWATVDQCTSAASGDVVGLRASMPGTGRRDERMYMRLRLQYRAPSGVWRYVKGADSGLIDAGSARYVSRQAGRDFHLAAGSASGTVLRGKVVFDWRVGASTIHHAQRLTTADREVGAGASPPGYSAARCTLS